MLGGRQAQSERLHGQHCGPRREGISRPRQVFECCLMYDSSALVKGTSFRKKQVLLRRLPRSIIETSLWILQYLKAPLYLTVKTKFCFFLANLTRPRFWALGNHNRFADFPIILISVFKSSLEYRAMKALDRIALVIFLCVYRCNKVCIMCACVCGCKKVRDML